jgi:UDP-N-acetylglucosamine:LPS N-acetylglucosamine transferase
MADYKILILTAPSGHGTLARAVTSYLDDLSWVKIKALDLVGKHIEWTMFRFLYRYFPALMKIPFAVTSNPYTFNWVKNSNIQRFRQLLPRILEEEAPDLVITTYHGYIPVLDMIKEKYKFRFVNLITDPVTMHPILFAHEADFNLAFSQALCAAGKKYNIPLERIVPAGWLTLRSFFEEQPTARIRRELGLEEQFTLLVCAGSEGSLAILNLLPILFFRRHPRPCQVIFITGHNRPLANAVRAIYRIAGHFNSHRPRIVVEEFTDKMYEFMAVSDVVIGKAGPNLIFEAAASRKPFVAVTHFGGNEDGNLNMIRQNNLGWVAESPFSSGPLIYDLIANPDLLASKTGDLDKIADLCHEGGLFLRKKVLEWKKPGL